MSYVGVNAAMSAARAERQWPNWFAPSAPAGEMRARLSGNLSYARCTHCDQRRTCRYELAADRFFCCEECFGLYYEDEFQARGLIRATFG